MKWEINREIGAKIREITEEAGKAAAEAQKLGGYQKEFAAIHAKYSQLYGKKFGLNQRKVKRRVEWKDLERMMHLIRAEDAQPQKTGFLGLGGMKKEEYYTLTDKLNVVASNLEAMAEDWDAYVAGKAGELELLLDAYEETYGQDWDAYGSALSRGTYEPPEKEEIQRLPLGKVAISPTGERHIADVLAKHTYPFYDGKSLRLLASLSLKEPVPCYIQYGQDSQLEGIHSWIRNLAKCMSCQMPAFHFELVYLDGLHNGSGLKEWLNLQSIHEPNVPDIAQKLQGNAMSILQVHRSSDDIRQSLQELERYMGAVIDLLQGCADYAEYNASHGERIPCRFVVLEGMDTYMDSTLIRKLLTNGPKCGIFVIYLQDARLLRENSDRTDLFAALPKVLYGEEGAILQEGEETYPVDLLTESADQSAYVSDIQAKLSVKRELDNSFDACFPEDYQWGRYTSTVELPNGNLEGRITIPFALDARGNIVSIELGSADYAHGLISGGTGSGKSTMLHMLINSVVMNYHPKDVEIWLADYKQTEMSVYIANRPPHVKFIGLERNEEFSFSLIDMIFEEYERRSRLFMEEGVRNIDAYKAKHGMNSLPRILVVIDEFHLMSQQVAENPTYSERLENILSEARAAGVVCLFSDQAVSVGLKGLTEKGKKQMRMRLAMANDKAEMGETLDTKISDEEAVMQMGEVKRKRMVTRMNAEGQTVREAVLELDKVIYLSDSCRERVARKAISIYGEGDAPVIVDGKKQAQIDWEAAEDYERSVADGRETFYLHLGKPSNFDPCYALPMIRDYGQNVMCIHDRYDLQKLVLVNAARSFLRTPEAKLYILADENDSLYRSARQELLAMQEDSSNIVIASDMEDVCAKILEINDMLVARRKKPAREADLVLWLGLDSMLREFQYYDPLPKDYGKEAPKAKSEQDKLMEELDRKMAFLFDDDSSGSPKAAEEQTEEESDGLLFDATEHVGNLVREGAKRGIFQFVFLSNVLALKSLRVLKTDNFSYKMSGYLDRDNSLEFYGNSRFMGSMSEKKDNISFVCYDGRQARFFVPYLL